MLQQGLKKLARTEEGKKDTYPGDGMEHAWSANEAYIGPASQVTVGAGGLTSGLLIAEADEADAAVEGLLGDVDHGNAHDVEDRVDAQALQGAPSAGCRR